VLEKKVFRFATRITSNDFNAVVGRTRKIERSLCAGSSEEICKVQERAAQ
jgi:hypothetical protein